MDKMSVCRVVWLLLSPLLAVEASPQFTTSLVSKTWEFLKGSPRPTEVNCMAETNSGLVNWQNPDYPNSESLPGICTLTLNPATGTCAYRLHFDNLDLTSKSEGLSQLLSSFSCPADSPYIKVSTVNYSAPARCQNITGYEGIVQLPEESSEPVVLLLQTDPNYNTSFRVNISSVACSDITSYTSPNVCGIKNQKLNFAGKNVLRSGAFIEDPTLMEKEAKSDITSLEGVDVQDENNLDATLENPDAIQEDIIETIEDARKSKQLYEEYSVEPNTDNPVFRRLTQEQVNKKNKKKDKGKVKDEKKAEKKKKVVLNEEEKELVEKLKEEENILAYGLALGLESGDFTFQPNVDKKVQGAPSNVNTRVPGVPSNPNEWPWMAFITYKAQIYVPIFNVTLDLENGCNGALLDESHVITQASCLPGSSVLKGSMDSIRVLLGDHDLVNETDTKNISVSVSKVTFPMTFSTIDVRDDIAILTLSESVNFTDTVRPVCLPVSYNNFPEDNGVLAGWANAGINDPSTITSPSLPIPSFGDPELNAVDVKVLDKSACNQTLSTIDLLLGALIGESSIDADEYVCLVDKENELPVCDVGMGTPLVREDITNAYYLSGISSVFSSCGTTAASIFTAIKPDDLFLNLALA